MGRLVPEALYIPSTKTEAEDIWARAAKNISRIDPTGSKSYALLKTMDWKYGGRSDRLRS